MSCFAYPRGCTINNKTSRLFSWVALNCRRLGLATLPKSVPPDVTRLDLSSNCIKSLTEVPVLKHLDSLVLKFNLIETVDWASLRNLPNLENLDLEFNRLTHVSLDAVVKNLPKLKSVNLSNNRLASFSFHELGHPSLHVSALVYIQYNPFNCSCAMLWLMNKLKCLLEPVEPELRTSSTEDCNCVNTNKYCELCEACILSYDIAFDAKPFECDSPAHLKGKRLTEVAQNLTGCGIENSASTATTRNTPGLQTRQGWGEGTPAGPSSSTTNLQADSKITVQPGDLLQKSQCPRGANVTGYQYAFLSRGPSD
ncbi:hypothetical protein Bbelb_215990 [Branchiostoma belcheri]|nr:hypothetical protein Bbelb_215990 [Branchiostoma belcheri]